MMETPHVAASALQAWRVLVVCANAARVAEIRLALHSWPVPVSIKVASNVMAALGDALAQPSRLVIVDWAIDGPGGQALVRQLARLRPTLPVLVFDVLSLDGPAEQVLAWPWDDLWNVLDDWRRLLVEEHGSAAEAPA